MSRHCGNVTVTISVVPVEFCDVVFYPYVPGNWTEPPEPPFVEYEAIKIGGVDVREALLNAQVDAWEDELINYLEN